MKYHQLTCHIKCYDLVYYVCKELFRFKILREYYVSLSCANTLVCICIYPLACGCTSLGSTGGCNPATGQCECKPNVQGFKCDSCLPDTFNYNSGIGCSPCDCHPQGAFSTSCNVVSQNK